MYSVGRLVSDGKSGMEREGWIYGNGEFVWGVLTVQCYRQFVDTDG